MTPMTELRIGDQTVLYDRAATAAIYSGVARGFVEECGSVFCRNFAAGFYLDSVKVKANDLALGVIDPGYSV
jgi:hypothetical protein